MTVPGGEPNITPGDWSASVDGSIPGMAGRTRNVVESSLKGDVAGSQNWGGASGTFFGTLLGGFMNGITGFIAQFVAGVFGGIVGGFLDLVGGFLGVKNDVQQVREVEVPRLDNRIDELAGGVQQYTFGTTGMFTKPAGATRIVVTLVGGGAGGSRYTRAAFPGGGCGGWTKWYEFLASEVPASVTVTVGPGGAGRTGDGQLGFAGGDTKFGSLLTAGGGRCLASGAQPGYGTELYFDGSGGEGSQGDAARPARAGGNGPFSAGGAGGVAGNLNGSPGVSPGNDLVGPGSGGGGGAAAQGNGGNGGSGGYPGGGGGGGGNYLNFGFLGNGGNGAPGAAWVRVYFN